MFEDFDYVELYVADGQQAASFLCAAYGFRKVAEAGPETGLADQRSLLLAQGSARLLLTWALQPTHPAAAYVERHGDGVHDIALRTPNAALAFKRAVEGGAVPLMEPTVFDGEGGRIIQATVSSPLGDVVHSLIERETQPGCFIPGRFRALEPAPPATPEMFSLIDHLAFCLAPGTLDEAMRMYEQAFGFHKSHEENISTEYSGMNSKVAQNGSGKICFAMQEPTLGTRRRGQLESFLASHGGAGVQHIALLTGDIVGTLRTLRSRDVQFLHTPGAYYDTLLDRVGPIQESLEELRANSVLVDRDAWGYLLQIFAKSVHPRNTLFLEVIQRRQSRGFGGNNIKALYEAIERERPR